MKLLSLVPCAIALALIANPASATLIGFQAEDGALGSNYDVESDPNALGGQYIVVNGGNTIPPTADETATYTADLAAGTYDLYVRIYVGPQGGSDDSFFAPDAFGVAADQNVAQLGAFNPSFYTDVNGVQVNFGATGAVNETYYWLNLNAAANNFGDNGAADSVFSTAGGIETIQLSNREDGLRIDALALGLRADAIIPTAFSEAELNSAVIPEPTGLCILASSVVALTAGRRRRK